jgi:hypothetical protein
MNDVPEMNRTEFADLKLFYKLYSLHFSEGRVSMIASLSERGPRLVALTVSQIKVGKNHNKFSPLKGLCYMLCALAGKTSQLVK